MKGWTAVAEWRRLHWETRWFLSGVHVGEAFWPAQPGERAASVREYEAGNVEWTRLPTVIAPGADVAAAVALGMAQGAPIPAAGVAAVIRRPTGF